LYDQATVQQLLMLCGRTLQAQPQLRKQVVEWFSGLMKGGRESIHLDLEVLRDQVDNTSQDGKPTEDFDLDNLPIDRLIPAFIKLITRESKQDDVNNKQVQIVRFALPNEKMCTDCARHFHTLDILHI
jgi:DNA cross-link repair 1C protein